MAANPNPDITTLEQRLQGARHGFGRMLFRWRSRYGWSGKTPGLWAKAAPNVLPFQVSSATWTSFETDKSRAPAPETFIALELMNRALSTGDVGVIKDQRLRERVKSAEAIRHEDGELWLAGDFFDCFIGVLPPPPALAPQLHDPAAAAEDFRQAFARATAAAGLGPATGILALFRSQPHLNLDMQLEVERVLTSQGTFTSADTAAAAAMALDAWVAATCR